MSSFTKKISAFFHKVGSDLSKVHVRAAFVDVEHRVEKFFKHAEAHAEKERQQKDETEG